MKMFQTMTTKRNWESLSRLQMKDGAISDGSGGLTAPSTIRLHCVRPPHSTNSNVERTARTAGARLFALLTAASRAGGVARRAGAGHGQCNLMLRTT